MTLFELMFPGKTKQDLRDEYYLDLRWQAEVEGVVMGLYAFLRFAGCYA